MSNPTVTPTMFVGEGRNNVIVFYHPEDYQDRVVEKAISDSPRLDELPPGAFMMVAPNGDGREVSWTKLPNRNDVLRTVRRGLPSLLTRIVDEVEGLGLLEPT